MENCPGCGYPMDACICEYRSKSESCFICGGVTFDGFCVNCKQNSGIEQEECQCSACGETTDSDGFCLYCEELKRN